MIYGNISKNEKKMRNVKLKNVMPTAADTDRAKCFLDSGMKPGEAAKRMDVPIKFVKACMR